MKFCIAACLKTLHESNAMTHCLSVQTSVKSRLPPGVDMNVNVLTSGYWPSYPHLEAKLPDELTRYQTVFKVLHCLSVRPAPKPYLHTGFTFACPASKSHLHTACAKGSETELAALHLMMCILNLQAVLA